MILYPKQRDVILSSDESEVPDAMNEDPA